MLHRIESVHKGNVVGVNSQIRNDIHTGRYRCRCGGGLWVWYPGLSLATVQDVEDDVPRMRLVEHRDRRECLNMNGGVIMDSSVSFDAVALAFHCRIRIQGFVRSGQRDSVEAEGFIAVMTHRRISNMRAEKPKL